jgi:hypothetical protein
MLGNSQLTHLIDQSGFYSSWFETAGPMDLVIYTLASFQLPLNIFIICVLLLYPKSKNANFNSFYFIINLAIIYIVGFIMTITSVFIQQDVWSHQRDYSDFDPVGFATKMKTGCRWQMGLLTFSYSNTVLATIFLSLDWNLFISRPLTYSLFVTKRRIKIMILISWSLPVISGLLTFFTTNLEEVKMCIPTHTSSRWPNFVTAFLVFLTIIAVYLLYVKILLSYWGLKRKLSTIKKANPC